MISFPTSIEKIMHRVEEISPIEYCKTRNYSNGAVTYLSPYIARGVISTKQVFESLIKRGFKPHTIEKLIQELAWRDYFQQIWINLGENINKDLKNPQNPIANYGIPSAIIEGNTNIIALDEAIKNFYENGYIHNHLRMYISSITCNIGQSYWKNPAQWMYYHLLDGDWASNVCSWQWVAGANSNKKYIANQENINKYCQTNQNNTFLSVPYENILSIEIPKVLEKISIPTFVTNLPNNNLINFDKTKPTLLYTYYNLDPFWHKDKEVNRILILEPSVFKNYPVSDKCIAFAIELSKNISNLQLYVGEFLTLKELIKDSQIIFKEHPLNNHFEGIKEERDWMFAVKGNFNSFFSFWKKCKKELS